MPTFIECLCCTEIDKIKAKINNANDVSVTCITQHPGFDAVCLNVWVLQAAYYQYKQEHGQASSPLSLNEYVTFMHVLIDLTHFYQSRKFRYIAYRQLTRWCWGWLGRNIRVTLPACAVNKIRDTFPSDNYQGFHFPSLDF